jgi:hypothetical protein
LRQGESSAALFLVARSKMEAKDLDKDEVTRKACLDESFSPDPNPIV